ncbi:MAG: hypothetical protein AAF629_05040 [Chloroflexota bacterium]
MKTRHPYGVLEILFLLIAISALVLAAINLSLKISNQAQASANVPNVEAHVQPTSVTFETAQTEPSTLQTESEDDTEDETFNDIDGLDEDEAEFILTDAAAQIMDMEVDQLEQAIFAGETISTIATARGLDTQQVVDQVVAQEQAHIQTLQKNNLISSEETEAWLIESATLTPFIIQTGYLEPELLAAQIIGVDLDRFFDLLERGETIETIALGYNVDPQTIIDTIIASETGLIGHLLSTQLIDAEEAQVWKAELRQDVESMVRQGEGGIEE